MLHMKYLRYSTLFRYARIFLSFIATQAVRLTEAQTGATVTFNNTLNQVTWTAHGFSTDEEHPIAFYSTTALPAELVAGQIYYLQYVDANTLTIFPTYADLLAAQNQVTFTDDGTGTHTAKPALTEDELKTLMRKPGNSADRVRGETDFTNL